MLEIVFFFFFSFDEILYQMAAHKRLFRGKANTHSTGIHFQNWTEWYGLIEYLIEKNKIEI